MVSQTCQLWCSGTDCGGGSNTGCASSCTSSTRASTSTRSCTGTGGSTSTSTSTATAGSIDGGCQLFSRRVCNEAMQTVTTVWMTVQLEKQSLASKLRAYPYRNYKELSTFYRAI